MPRRRALRRDAATIAHVITTTIALTGLRATACTWAQADLGTAGNAELLWTECGCADWLRVRGEGSGGRTRRLARAAARHDDAADPTGSLVTRTGAAGAGSAAHTRWLNGRTGGLEHFILSAAHLDRLVATRCDALSAADAIGVPIPVHRREPHRTGITRTAER
jgi:hypothetical protein